MVGVQSWLLLILVSVSMTMTACKKSDSKSQARRGGHEKMAPVATTAQHTQNPIQDSKRESAPPPETKKTIPDFIKEYFKHDDKVQDSADDNSRSQDGSEETIVGNVTLDEKLIDETKTSALQMNLSTAPEGQTPADTEKSSTLSNSSRSNCETIKSQLATFGWVHDEVEVYENPQSQAGKKLKIAYYRIQNRPLNNPVLYLMGYANRQLTQDFLTGMKHQADTYNFDPIIMESRGAGCSSALPGSESLKDWQYYASRSIALDAEMIRKKLLDDKKWRIWGHEYAGYIALRIVEIAPEGVLSVHITEFAPMKSFTDYMKARVESQWRAWESFKEYFKAQQKVEIKNADLQKAKAFLDQQSCPEDQKICGANLLDLLVYDLARGDRSSWQQASQIMSSLLSEDTGSLRTLNTRAIQVQKGKLLASALRMIDMDQDLNQTACTEAMKSVSDRAKESPFNSCRTESQVVRDDI